VIEAATVRSGSSRFRLDGAVRGKALVAVELISVIAWALSITSAYLNLDPALTPFGREYSSAIQTHHLWTRARECGLCALWNGSVRGGAPAFADLHGSMLHPLVIATTLIWGVLNGSKIALVGAFVMAGLAQWWLAYTLGVGRVARVWSACLAVAAGHLAGRMELGAFGVVLSLASCSLTLPLIVLVSRTGSRRAAVALGVTLGLAALAGQGYIQVGLALTLPAVLLLIPWQRERSKLIVKRYALAIGLALLLAAVFLVPFARFLPEFDKFIDPEFKSPQPFVFVPLNLVINDHNFYAGEALGMGPGAPHLYENYIGWIAVLLAVWGLRSGRTRDEQKAVAFLAVMALLALWIASGEPLAALYRIAPARWLADIIAGIRHPSQIAGLAVPPILALAALGLDRLLSRGWPQLQLALLNVGADGRRLAVHTRWLMAIPLLVALSDVQVFGSQWITLAPTRAEIDDVLDALRTPDVQWVNTPVGEHFFVEPAVGRGLKLAAGIRTWNWKGHDLPEPALEANRVGPPKGMTQQVEVVGGIPIYTAPPGREYAFVAHDDGSRTACAAQGVAGDIDVKCDLAGPGQLVVRENSWAGWQARRDGEALPLRSSQWLSVSLPAGRHTIQFRYRPWDAPLGLALTLLGGALGAYLWLKRDAPLTSPPPP
jgi:hypothetical protein